MKWERVLFAIAIVFTCLFAISVPAEAQCAPDADDDDDDNDDNDDDNDDDDSGGDDDAGDDDTSGDDDTGDDDDDDDDAGTWTDTLTGLTWEVNPADDWLMLSEAEAYCANLDLGKSSGWRLPTISELRSLIRDCADTEADGPCGVTDNCAEYVCQDEACNGCEYGGGPGPWGEYWPAGLTGPSEIYWSSTRVTDDTGRAWTIDFHDAYLAHDNVFSSSDRYARCVR